MNQALKFAIFLFVSFQMESISVAQVLTKKPSILPRYPSIRADFDNQWSNAITSEQKLNVFRNALSKGRHSGNKLMINMFKNFDPTFFYLDPDLPGLKDVVKMIASDNSKKSAGHARELLYANSIKKDGRFKINSFGEKRDYPNLISLEGVGVKPIPITKGEADLYFTHVETGVKVRMEVKKTKLSTQRANLIKYKRQIIKMAYDFQTRGEIQVFVNRHEILPELKEFAKKHGVQVAENISSNSNPKMPSHSISTVINSLDKDCIRRVRISILTGSSINAAMGIYFAIHSGSKLKNSIQAYDGSEVTNFRIAKDGISFLGGLSFASGQFANLALRNPKWENSKHLKTFSKYAGGIGIAFAIFGETLEVYDFARGHQTPREFYRGQASIVAGFGGGAGGAYLGVVVCSPIFPPFGSIVGGIVFGVGGGFFGSIVAEKTADQIYYFKDQKLDDRYYAEVLKKHYFEN